MLHSVFQEDTKRWQATLSGEIDIYNAEKLREELSALVGEAPCDIELDCKGLTYIDSTGIGVLVSALKPVCAAGKGVHIINLKPYIYKIFDLTNLGKLFKIEVPHE